MSGTHFWVVTIDIGRVYEVAQARLMLNIGVINQALHKNNRKKETIFFKYLYYFIRNNDSVLERTSMAALVGSFRI